MFGATLSPKAPEPPSVRADAIVVLGCRVLPSGRLTAAAEGRAEAAAAAYRAGLAPRIVASGGRRWGAQIEALALQRSMIARGVPRAAIIPELWSLTTCENAIFSAALLRRLGARSAVIVTCSWHVRRALMSFRSTGLEAAAWPPASPPRDLPTLLLETGRHLYDMGALRQTAVLAQDAAAFFASRREALSEGS